MSLTGPSAAEAALSFRVVPGPAPARPGTTRCELRSVAEPLGNFVEPSNIGAHRPPASPGPSCQDDEGGAVPGLAVMG